MKHDTGLERRLIEYADGTLDGAEAARVAAHLEECDGCRDTLAAHERSLERLRAGLSAPPKAAAPCLAAIRERTAQRRRRQRTGWMAGAGAACLLAVAFALGGPEHPVSPPPARHIEVAQDTAEARALALLEAKVAVLERELAALKAREAAKAGQAESLADVEYEGVAAISVAAGLNLEERFGDTRGALERYHYAARLYPRTQAAAKARARIAALQKGST